MPANWSCWATFSVVLWVHFKPVIGSPAVSCSKSHSMVWITSGVFFPPACDRRPSGACDPPEHLALPVDAGLWPRCGGQGRAIQRSADRRRGPAAGTEALHIDGVVA